MANKKTTDNKEETKTKKTTKKSTTKKNTTSKKTTTKKKEVKLEDTVRIRIDDDRVNDADSLDTSFIEGKKRKKIKENHEAKEKILTESKDYSKVFTVIKFIIYILAACCIVFLGVIALKNNKIFDNVTKDTDVEEKEDSKEKVKLPDNYLFVGDFYVKNMDFEDFLYPYVKVSDLEYTTDDLLNNIENDIYVYNPSTVFIEIGYNDLNNEVSEEDIIANLEEIIKGIKSNRVYAKIYVESLYPINLDDGNVTNKEIKSLNKRIKNLTKSLEVNYIDMYSELLEDDKLKEDYSDDGINLNENGYKRVFKVINRIVDEEHEKDQ